MRVLCLWWLLERDISLFAMVVRSIFSIQALSLCCNDRDVKGRFKCALNTRRCLYYSITYI